MHALALTFYLKVIFVVCVPIDSLVWCYDYYYVSIPIQARDGDNVCVALSTQHFNAGRYSLVNIRESKDVSE